MTLEPEDLHHLSAAYGYCDLKMYGDAGEELEKISRDYHDLPEVAGARLAILQGLKQWDRTRDMARELAQGDPGNVQWWISWAYATRRAESIGAAKAILLEAVKQHSDEPLIHYNLACYDCQLGDLETAKAYLKRAFKLESGYRKIAAGDEDLIPLKALIRGE